jgi:hypothetical protein
LTFTPTDCWNERGRSGAEKEFNFAQIHNETGPYASNVQPDVTNETDNIFDVANLIALTAVYQADHASSFHVGGPNLVLICAVEDDRNIVRPASLVGHLNEAGRCLFSEVAVQDLSDRVIIHHAVQSVR